MLSPGFKNCPLYGVAIPNIWCLFCLGEVHHKECCLICSSFKKRTQVVLDLHLKQHLVEQAMRPDPVPRPSSSHRSPSDSKSAVASCSEARASLKMHRNCSPSSAPKKRWLKTYQEHSRFRVILLSHLRRTWTSTVSTLVHASLTLPQYVQGREGRHLVLSTLVLASVHLSSPVLIGTMPVPIASVVST